MTRVKLPLPLRRYAGERTIVEVDARTVGECLEELVRLHPEVASRLRDEDGELAAGVNLYLNRDDVRYLAGLDTVTCEDDELSVVVAIAGGSAEVCRGPVPSRRLAALRARWRNVCCLET